MRTPYERKEMFGAETEIETVKSILLEKYERCVYCGSKLLFSHDLNLGLLEIVESSRCTGCGVSHHPKKFTLQ